jgi:hypothetical protein
LFHCPPLPIHPTLSLSLSHTHTLPTHPNTRASCSVGYAEQDAPDNRQIG